ncbi:MAG TPA: DUF1360 domain-containing protein [Candidatus Paceibacterota bacterium]|nr:DUF1360 domain-containing protein [Candidatus Paceibacterota bacterium]
MKAFWNIAFSVFFLFLLVNGIAWLAMTGKFDRPVSLGDFVLMALATWRLIRLFTYDAITAFVRDWFANAAPHTFLGTLKTLINCPWCIGLWFSFIVVFFYFATIYAWPVILILALAAIGSFLQILSNLVGWSAEAKKRSVLGSGPGQGGTCG